jgi:hypothetical protein
MRITDDEKSAIALAYEYMLDKYRRAIRRRGHNRDESEIEWLKNRLRQFQSGTKKLGLKYIFRNTFITEKDL